MQGIHPVSPVEPISMKGTRGTREPQQKFEGPYKLKTPSLPTSYLSTTSRLKPEGLSALSLYPLCTDLG